MTLTNSISNIPREIFVSYIVEKLRKTNPHLAHAFDESKFVIGGAVVHVPQAGNSPDVVKNRSSFPAVAVMRGDSQVTYTLDVYSTDPTHVTWHEGAEISYEKTDSVLNDHVNTLIEAIGDHMLYNWIHGLVKNSGGTYDLVTVPAANIIRTSGDFVAVNPEDGQEGTRRAFHHRELSRAQSLMNKMNVPKEGRFVIMESYMYQQFVDSLSENLMAAFQKSADMANGVVGKLYGFNIMERSTVLAFEADGETPLVPGAVLEASSNLAALAWQKDCVTKAQGSIENFEKIKDPQYYGDIFSALVKHGGRARREDWKGVLAIVQEAPAAEETELSEETEITSFEIGNQVGQTVIDTAAGTIEVTMPNGTNVTALEPTITLSEGASVEPESGEPQDFTTPVTYTVTAEDGVTEQIYEVTVIVELE